MEITINEKTYPLKASFAFLKKIEPSDIRESSGEKIEFGLPNALIQISEVGDVRYLVDLIVALNTGLTPRLERTVVEHYLEDECEDVEKLIDEVFDFLSRANVCKMRLKKLDVLRKQAESPELKA